MPDAPRTSAPELAALSDDFDVVGELGGRTPFLIATRKSIAGNRRDESNRVLIEIVRPPVGDESHALDHLASDTKLLSGQRHRRFVSILEGKWLGDDAFAVVREYVDDPSVADLLARGDVFTNTRTAAILREVHGLLQWARNQNVVHRRVTTDRLFLEPTSDRVRVSFAVAPLQRVRTTDATTEDVVTVVRLAVAMLAGGITAEEADGRSFAELRPDLPDRLFDETERLLTEPATDSDLTLYLALIGMADPVAEGETERDRIRAEVLEEQRVEREKLARERADLERHVEEERRRLAEEGEELRGAFAQEKAKLEREFAAAQRLLAAERAEMQRIIAAERAELLNKREALQREVGVRLAELERAAAADRAKLDELRASIQEAGEVELERKRTAALEDLDDSEIRLHTGRYATPKFGAPKLTPLPGIAFHRDEHLKEAEPIGEPTLPAEPATVIKVVHKLRSPRRRPSAWRRYAVRGAIAAAILITAGYAVLVESRSPGFTDTLGSSAPAIAPATPAPPPSSAVAPVDPGAVTTSSPGGLSATGTPVDSASLAAAAPVDSAIIRARRDSARRVNAARIEALRADSARARASTQPATRRVPAARGDPRDLMDLSDSLSNAESAPEPDPPTLPQPNGNP
jgi:hypothetical protein